MWCFIMVRGDVVSLGREKRGLALILSMVSRNHADNCFFFRVRRALVIFSFADKTIYHRFAAVASMVHTRAIVHTHCKLVLRQERV